MQQKEKKSRKAKVLLILLGVVAVPIIATVVAFLLQINVSTNLSRLTRDDLIQKFGKPEMSFGQGDEKIVERAKAKVVDWENAELFIVEGMYHDLHKLWKMRMNSTFTLGISNIFALPRILHEMAFYWKDKYLLVWYFKNSKGELDKVRRYEIMPLKE